MIEARDLTKLFGDFRAVYRLNMKLDAGDVYGFIGPNGSGKTTTMRMLATLLNPSWGEAYVCNYSIYTGAKEIRRLVGYMPDFFGVYDDMKVIEYLEFFASAYRIKGPQRRKICEDMLELVGMTYKRDAYVNTLSRGQTQRVGLARVLLHDPQVLLLDEPASGLDPRARIEIRALLKKLREMGKTILVSSHILPELADVCNKIGIIERGELLAGGDVDEIMRRVRRRIVLDVGVARDQERAARLLGADERISAVDARNGRLSVTLREKQCRRTLDVPLAPDEIPEDLRPSLSYDPDARCLAWRGMMTDAQRDRLRALRPEPAFQQAIDALYAQSHEPVDYSFVSEVLVEGGCPITLLREQEINLETAFLELTKGIN